MSVSFGYSGGCFTITDSELGIVYSGNNPLRFKSENNTIEVIVSNLGGSGNPALIGSYPLNSITSINGQAVSGTIDGVIAQLNSITLNSSAISGQTDNGEFRKVPVTAEGHLEMAIHSPRLPFGSIHTESLTPVFQADGVYGINTALVNTYATLSGTATTENSSFKVSTGTTQFSQATIQSRKRLRYRAGQGLVGRFAGLFNGAVNNSYALAGFGHSEDGVYFGYKNTEFGILYTNRGVRECRTLTVTTGATGAANATVTLNGTQYTVALSGVGSTAGERIQRTVQELSEATYNGWTAYPLGSTVVFLSGSSGAKSGTYSLTHASAVGTFAQTKAGVAETQDFIPQTEWNGDKLDGTGASGFTADWSKGNVFQIKIQYLGFGAIIFEVEVTPDGNNPEFITAHTIKLPNTLTDTTFGNPSYPFTMAAYSAGSTTDVSVKVGSFGGFIEGEKLLHGGRFTYGNNISTASSTNIQALFTVYNADVYANRSNQTVINILSGGLAYKHTQPATFFIIKNGILGGYPNFTQYATNSCSLIDTAATTVSITTNDQIIYSLPMGETGQQQFMFSDEITLQPGEWLTIGCRTASQTATFAAATLNTREDQ